MQIVSDHEKIVSLAASLDLARRTIPSRPKPIRKKIFASYPLMLVRALNLMPDGFMNHRVSHACRSFMGVAVVTKIVSNHQKFASSFVVALRTIIDTLKNARQYLFVNLMSNVRLHLLAKKTDAR